MTKKNKTRDGMKILRQRYGVDPETDAQVLQFNEQIEIAEMLFAARQKAGLTQNQLAEMVGTKQQVISQLENADYEGHSLSMLRRIAQALNQKVELRLVPANAQTA